MKHREGFILERIIQYADEVAQTIEVMEINEATFQNDFIARNAITMCILQIGELANHLSEPFKQKYAQIPWQQIIGMRNKAAHGYWHMSHQIIWQVATENMPELKTYCLQILQQEAP